MGPTRCYFERSANEAQFHLICRTRHPWPNPTCQGRCQVLRRSSEMPFELTTKLARALIAQLFSRGFCGVAAAEQGAGKLHSKRLRPLFRRNPKSLQEVTLQMSIRNQARRRNLLALIARRLGDSCPIFYGVQSGSHTHSYDRRRLCLSNFSLTCATFNHADFILRDDFSCRVLLATSCR